MAAAIAVVHSPSLLPCADWQMFLVVTFFPDMFHISCLMSQALSTSNGTPSVEYNEIRILYRCIGSTDLTKFADRLRDMAVARAKKTNDDHYTRKKDRANYPT
jgi:hypothetical protein